MKPSFNIPLHCFWAKLNHRTGGQCDLSIWFCLCFAFVRSHAQCGCFSIVCWRGWSFHLKLDIQGQGDENVSDVNRKACVCVGGVFENYGRHMCIIPIGFKHWTLQYYFVCNMKYLKTFYKLWRVDISKTSESASFGQSLFVFVFSNNNICFVVFKTHEFEQNV